LDAIGYGFLVPVFFVSSGVALDLRGLIAEPSALLRVPVFLIALLFVRGVPALLYYRSFGRSATVAAALLQATSLPFLVTAATIGMQTDSSHRRPGRRWCALGCFR
jgi:Kef-type K+ transport system membrane component KefB